MSPVTFTVVLHISRKRSTPKMIPIPSVGIPNPARIVVKITIPIPGVLGVPIEAPTVVKRIKTS